MLIQKRLQSRNFFTSLQKKFRGKIESVSSRIDPSTRSILARVIVDNKSYEIIPGQLMTVKLFMIKTTTWSRKCYNMQETQHLYMS